MTTATNVEFTSNGSTYTTLLDLVYPVGSVYLSRNSSSGFGPGNIFGGTWTELNRGKCLRTFTGSNINLDGGSDKHVHSVAGPSDWSESESQKYGVRTSMTIGGTNWGDKTDTGAADNGGVIWSRWAPCKAGTLSNHPGFSPNAGKGYEEGHGISFTFNEQSVGVWGNVAKDGSQKLGNTVYTEIFCKTIGLNPDGSYSYSTNYGNTIPACYGWTRPNSQADYYQWDNQGNYNGDGSLPVAYTQVRAFQRTV